MSKRTIGKTLTWAGTVLGGAWLSMWTARCVTETVARCVGVSGADEPVRELVEEALVEQHGGDTPMAHAFEEALADDTEAPAEAR